MISIQYSDWSILKILIGQWLTSIWDFFLTFSTAARNSPRVVCSSSAPTGPLIADRVLLLNNQYNMIGQYNMISQCIMIGYLLVLLLTLGLLSALFLLTSLLVLSQCSEMIIEWLVLTCWFVCSLLQCPGHHQLHCCSSPGCCSLPTRPLAELSWPLWWTVWDWWWCPHSAPRSMNHYHCQHCLESLVK